MFERRKSNMEQTKRKFPYYPDLDAIPEKSRGEGLTGKAIYGENLMVVIVDLAADIEIPDHNHPHEQMGYVISGELEFNIDGQKKLCRVSDIYFIPSNIKHSVKVTSDGPARIIDIYSPPREDLMS
jgi:quercetin dioxygenase-like cupin family protein